MPDKKTDNKADDTSNKNQGATRSDKPVNAPVDVTKSKPVDVTKSKPQQAPEEAPAKNTAKPTKATKEVPLDDNITINDAEEWQEVRENWTKKQASRLKAEALRVFETDEDLPLSRHFLILFIVVFWCGVLIWANFAELDEVTHGQGKIIPSTQVQALQSLESGIVEEFLVRTGEEVKKGQVLVRLNAIEAESDLGANEARYLGLLASITRLQAEAEGKPTVEFPENVIKKAPQSVTEELNAFRANRQSLQSQLNIVEQQLMQREQEVRELQTRISDTRGVVSLQRQEKAMIAPLVESGAAPKIELLQLERGLREKMTELNGYTSSLPRVKSAIEEAKARIAEVTTNMKAQAQTELSVKMVEMNEIKERLSALNERATRTDIRSPVDGKIQDITINTIGGVIRAGEDLIKIVPRDDKLIVEAEVKPSDRAFIFPGQKAIVKLTAYDFSIYGGLKAELIDISPDTFEDQEGNSFYKVKLRTEKTELVRKGEILPIEVGMIATADILTGKKTVLQFWLKPLRKTLDNAMTER